MVEERIGKLRLEEFEKLVKEKTGHPNKKVLVPPLTGVDAGVVEVNEDQVMVIAEDPIFPVPGIPNEMFGWFIVHIGASDVAVMGVPPQYMTYSLLLPPKTGSRELEEIVEAVHKTAKELEISIVGGHTGYYPSVVTPVIGGITVFSFCGKDDYVTPMGARPGNKVILTKGPAIEATALLSTLYEEKLLESSSTTVVEKAKARRYDITVVKDALSAMSAGGVTAMHDATEGGVAAALFEVANASKVGVTADESLFVHPEEVRLVCDELGIDSLKAISEGSLIITAERGSEETIVKNLANTGIESSVVGEVIEKNEGMKIKRLDGKMEELRIPSQDPFWPAFFKGLSKTK